MGQFRNRLGRGPFFLLFNLDLHRKIRKARQFGPNFRYGFALCRTNNLFKKVGNHWTRVNFNTLAIFFLIYICLSEQVQKKRLKQGLRNSIELISKATYFSNEMLKVASMRCIPLSFFQKTSNLTTIKVLPREK